MLVGNWQFLEVNEGGGGESLAAPWRDLARRAVEPSGLNRPEFIAPQAAARPDARILTVSQGERLLLAMAAERRGLLPFRASLATPLSGGAIPHLDSQGGEAALAALLRQTREPLLLRAVPADGPFRDRLGRAARRLAVIEGWQRAALAIEGSYEHWFEATFSGKRRKQYRRLEARLAELGTIEIQTLGTAEEAGPWVGEFLALEARGWKGRRGTALAQQEGMAEALAAAAAALHRGGHLRFWKLALDGRAIAMLFAVAEGGKVWLGKIAHDEDFARFSPGVLMILAATRRLFAGGGISHVDSCAIPGHPMIDTIWEGRLAVADILVAGPGVGALRFGATVLAERCRRRLRAVLRDAWYGLRGWHRS